LAVLLMLQRKRSRHDAAAGMGTVPQTSCLTDATRCRCIAAHGIDYPAETFKRQLLEAVLHDAKIEKARYR
jgi:hypothetical protein